MLSVGSPSLSSGILQMATGRGVTIAVTFITAPILSRLFPPSAFGAVAVLSTICGCLAPFATWGYSEAMPLAASARERRALFVLCVLAISVMTTLVIVATSVAGEHLAAAFHEPQVGRYVWFLPMLFSAGAVKTLLDMTLSCERLFAAVSLRAVAEVVVTRFSQIGSCAVGLASSPLGLFIGSMVGTWTAALMSGLTSVSRVLRGSAERFEGAEMWRVASRYRQFPLVFLWIETLNAVTVGLPQMMLGLRFSLDDVGYFGVGSMMIALPLSLFANSSSRVFYVEAAELVSHGKSAALTTQHLIRLLNTLIPFPLSVVALLGPMLFESFLGSRWREAGVFAQILAPSMVLMAYSNPLGSAYAIFGRQAEMFRMNLLLLAMRFCVLYYGGIWASIRVTLVFFALAGFLVSFWYVIRTTRMLGVSRLWLFRDTISAYTVALAMLLPSAALYWWVGSVTASLVTLAAASGLHVILLYRRHPNILKRLLPVWLGPRSA